MNPRDASASKIHSHDSGTGIRGFHSLIWTGTGIPAHSDLNFSCKVGCGTKWDSTSISKCNSSKQLRFKTTDDIFLKTDPGSFEDLRVADLQHISKMTGSRALTICTNLAEKNHLCSSLTFSLSPSGPSQQRR